MADKRNERRQYDRHKTEVDVYFDFIYDIETKVQFELIDSVNDQALSQKYSAVSKNIGVEGLCFSSSKGLKKGDLLHLELYLPGAKTPIHMKGGVKWCRPVPPSVGPGDNQSSGYGFETGVKMIFVNDIPVQETVYYDKTYNVVWSIVLESVFDNYKVLMAGKFKSQQK